MILPASLFRFLSFFRLPSHTLKTDLGFFPSPAFSVNYALHFLFKISPVHTTNNKAMSTTSHSMISPHNHEPHPGHHHHSEKHQHHHHHHQQQQQHPKTSGGASILLAPATATRMQCFAADFSASWMSYSIALMAAHPVDTLRVKQQHCAKNRSALAILRRDGPLSMYSGFRTPLLSNGPIVACIFAANEYFRVFFRGCNVRLFGATEATLPPAGRFTHTEMFCAGFTAGGMSSLVASPASYIKIQQQTRGGRHGKAPSASAVIKEVIRAHGPQGLWRGVATEWAANSVGRGVYFTIYETLKETLHTTCSSSSSSSVSSSAGVVGTSSSSSRSAVAQEHLRKFFINFFAAALTSTIGWLSIFHFEQIKVVVMSDAIDPRKQRFPSQPGLSMRVAREIFRRGGLWSFYRGLGLTLAKSWLSSGLSLPLFDVFKPRMRSLLVVSDIGGAEGKSSSSSSSSSSPPPR